jgi:hypothetical protein
MGPTADPIQLDPDKEPKANWFSNQENYNKNNNIYTTNNNNIFSINTLNYKKKKIIITQIIIFVNPTIFLTQIIIF